MQRHAKLRTQTLISTGAVPTALQLTRSCSFSMKTNVKIVWGLCKRKSGQSYLPEPSPRTGGEKNK